MTRQWRREDELSLVSFYYLVFLLFCCFVLITPWPPYQNSIFSLTVVEADSGIQTLSEGKIETHFAVIWRRACKALPRSYSDIRWLLCITAQLKGSMQSGMSLLVGQHYFQKIIFQGPSKETSYYNPHENSVSKPLFRDSVGSRQTFFLNNCNS